MLPGPRVLASCPTYPGLAGALSGTRAELVRVPADAAGEDPGAIADGGRVTVVEDLTLADLALGGAAPPDARRRAVPVGRAPAG